MRNTPTTVAPLSYKKRRRTFAFLVLVFLISLPFLYLYANGYRFDFRKPTNLVSTGGMYIAVDRTGAEIYIDGELVRETRAFKKAFYAQNLDVGTHRVHVQKKGYHTWVKELPVSKHLVTEAEAFNLPLVPKVRVISQWETATGTVVVRTALPFASSTNEVVATTTKLNTAFKRSEEFKTLISHFGTTTENEVNTRTQYIKDILTGTTTEGETPSRATTTVTTNGVRLAEAGDELYATWVGTFDEMPYYYCATDFPSYSTTSTSTFTRAPLEEIMPEQTPVLDEDRSPQSNELFVHPVQTVPKDTTCTPTIRVDRKDQKITEFNFSPGSTDFLIIGLEDGIYMVEVDDRSWQNMQPILLGKNLRFYIENGTIYVYDGNLIYQILSQPE